MTADADLTEQIARALTEALYGADVEERTRRVLPDQADRLLALYHQQSMEYAAAVLPIIAAEVQAAKAEALRDAERVLERGWPYKLGIDLPPEDYDHAGDHAMETAQEYLKLRATEYETGGRA